MSATCSVTALDCGADGSRVASETVIPLSGLVPGSSSLLHDVKASAADNNANENNVNFFIELELLKSET